MDHDVLDFRISICGIAELPAFEDDSVSHVVSILDPQTPEPEAFGAFTPHRRETMRFDDAIKAGPGLALPDVDDIEAILAFGETLEREAVTHLLVHCHAGVSRSTATVALLLGRANQGREKRIFETIRELRPRSWPNSRMIQIGDDLLGRGGALVRAMRDHHRLVADQHPDLADIIRLHGRAHEVPDTID